MKVSELAGVQLDYWVSKAEGRITRIVGIHESERCESRPDCNSFWDIYSPSTNWAQGGPIIERERLIVGTRQRMADTGRWAHLHWVGRAYHRPDDADYAPGQIGNTALVAVMRAYVKSKFGPEVSE